MSVYVGDGLVFLLFFFVLENFLFTTNLLIHNLLRILTHIHMQKEG